MTIPALVVALLLPAPVAVTSSTKPPIIDMHLHALPLDWFGPLPLSWAPAGLSIAVNQDDLRKRTFAELDRNNVVKAATSGPLDLVRAWKAVDPARVLAGTIEVGAPRDISEFRRLYTSGELQIVGEFGPQYVGRPASDQALDPVFAVAEELDVPIGVHMGIGPPGGPFECCQHFRAAAGDPLSLEAAIIRHPKLRLYVMHAGWPHLDHTIALLQLYPTVHADLSVINWYIPRPAFHEYLRRLVDAGFGKRLMFGSDQMLWPEAITKGIEAIEAAPFLSPEQKRDILYNNAARFLRLDGTKQ